MPVTAPRLYVEAPLAAGSALALGPAASRHAQVLRLQPGDALTLFNGGGGEWRARLAAMTRREATADVIEHQAIEREAPLRVTLALAMPAGDRMDFVVEKATELGAFAIQPLLAERSVLRLSGERAHKRRSHWQAIAVAACEQCGRNRVPAVAESRTLADWLGTLPATPGGEARLLLGWRDARAWREASPRDHTIVLSGPEGGFTGDEEALARQRGFGAVSLGERVLRADTAPLAALAALCLNAA